MRFIEIVSGKNIKNAKSLFNLRTFGKSRVHTLPIIQKKIILENFEMHKSFINAQFKTSFYINLC
jgi:hypothetical protein